MGLSGWSRTCTHKLFSGTPRQPEQVCNEKKTLVSVYAGHLVLQLFLSQKFSGNHTRGRLHACSTDMMLKRYGGGGKGGSMECIGGSYSGVLGNFPSGMYIPAAPARQCCCLLGGAAGSYAPDYFPGTTGDQFHFYKSSPSFLKQLQSLKISEQYRHSSRGAEKDTGSLLALAFFSLLSVGFPVRSRLI